MTKTQDSVTDKILNTVAERVGILSDELHGDTKFADLGVDDILAKSTVSRIAEKIGLCLPDITFNDHSTVGSLRSHLQDSPKPSVETRNHGKPNSMSPTPAHPLSIVLQGEVASANMTIFLLPDGSGSAMVYSRLLAIDLSVCLIGMNNPFLDACEEGKSGLQLF